MPFRALAVSALALVVLPAGCGSDDEQGTAPPGPPTTVESQPVATVPETAPAIVKVYFLREGKVQTASRGVVSGPQIGRAAMLELLEGPGTPERAAGLATDIPAGTRLESLTIEDGAAYVELSQSLSEEAAAQVVYTLTQFRTVQRVRLEGEEHLARTDFETETPAILVESPTAREEVSSPLRITGQREHLRGDVQRRNRRRAGPRPRQTLRDRDVGVGDKRDVRRGGFVQGERQRPRQAHRLRAVGRGWIAHPRSRDSPANRALRTRREHVQEERVARPARMLRVTDLA